MAYLKLFHGREHRDQDMDDWGFDGPIFGPVPFVHTTYASDIKFDEDSWLAIDDGMVYYDGCWYGDWSVFDGPLDEDQLRHLSEYEQEKSVLPKADEKEVAA